MGSNGNFACKLSTVSRVAVAFVSTMTARRGASEGFGSIGRGIGRRLLSGITVTERLFKKTGRRIKAGIRRRRRRFMTRVGR